MGKLIYNITTSLDGYAADKSGNIDWTEPTEEILASINKTLANVGTFLLGRKMYETLAVWDTIATDGPSKGTHDFAKIWRNANKIVYSSQLLEVKTANTTIEKVFDIEVIRKMIMESDKDFDIGGPHLSAAAIQANIVDEYHQYIAPLLLGSGNYWLPKDADNKLKFVELKKFNNDTVYLHYDKV